MIVLSTSNKGTVVLVEIFSGVQFSKVFMSLRKNVSAKCVITIKMITIKMISRPN